MVVEFTRRLNELSDKIVDLDMQPIRTIHEERIHKEEMRLNNALHREVKRLFEFYVEQQRQREAT